jgi:hypothetical protein
VKIFSVHLAQEKPVLLALYLVKIVLRPYWIVDSIVFSKNEVFTVINPTDCILFSVKSTISVEIAALFFKNESNFAMTSTQHGHRIN